MIYQNRVYALSRSITFKSIWSAFQMNTKLTELGIPVPDDKKKWRYFMHLAGDVHELDDNLMIDSLDSNQLVSLNADTLKAHKKTATYYKERENREKLHDLFPYYRLFIDGLFEPVPYEKSIAAEDGDILRYDEDLVETQEVSLIPNLESFIKAEHYQYMAESWAAMYPMYVPWFVGKVYALLPSKIDEFRIRKLHTVETHTHYITEFLRSHKGLDRYIPYLTTNQKLFLYRNIRYIERNAGRQETFEFLIENLLTVRGIPVEGYELTENYSDMANGGYLRKPVGYKLPLNFPERITGRDVETVTLDEMIDLEAREGIYHERLLENYREEAHAKAKRSKNLASPTKLIEVTGTDPNSIRNETFLDRLVYDWCYFSATGQYNTFVDLVDPQSGSNIRLSTLEAFCLFIYAYYKGYHETEVATIPPFSCSEQEDGTWYQADDYRKGLIDRATVVREGMINFFIETHVTLPTPYNDRLSFYNSSYERWQNKASREYFVSSQRTDLDRADAEYMYRMNYKERFLNHEYVGQRYRDFLLERGFQLDGFTTSIWKDLCMDLLKLAVDYDPDAAIGFSEIQEQLVDLFQTLSSYTIQMVNKYGSSDELTMEAVGAMVTTIEVESESALIVNYESSAVNEGFESEGIIEAPVIGMDYTTSWPDDIQEIVVEQEMGAVPELIETLTVNAGYESSATVERLD